MHFDHKKDFLINTQCILQTTIKAFPLPFQTMYQNLIRKETEAKTGINTHNSEEEKRNPPKRQ